MACLSLGRELQPFTVASHTLLESEEAMWSDFHRNPRVSYYLSLRTEYRRSAADAFRAVNRIDAMVVKLEQPGRDQTSSWRVVTGLRKLSLEALQCLISLRRLAHVDSRGAARED